MLNRRRPVATNGNRALLIALPQVAVCVALVVFRNGHERASYDLGLFPGFVLMGLTAAGARWGASRGVRRASHVVRGSVSR